MTRRENRWTAIAIVALAVAFNAIVLAPDISIGRVNLNDNVFHFTIIDAVVQRVAHGQSPLDFWMPEWSFGYPVVRDYQPLGHWLVAAIHFMTGRQFPLDGLFSFIRYLLLVIFPVSAFVACRATGLRPMTASAVAALTPLVASPNLYGIEYGSYIWRGNGLFTQLVATHFFVLAIGAGCAAIRRGKWITIAGALLALTFLSHFIYGYMAAATLILVAAIPGGEDFPIRRAVRLVWVGTLSFALAAFQIVPMLQDGPFINRSRWEPVWKWDSFGFAQVFGLTASGNLLDAQRLPVVSLLALAGAIAVIRRRGDDEPDARFAKMFAFAGAALWLILFCGRAAWGPLFRAIGLSDAAQLHRFIGGAQWFLLILAGIGLARLWALPRERGWRYASAAAVALTVVLLWLPVQERRNYLRDGYAWGRENLALYETHRAAIAQTIATVQQIGGRTFPGLAAQWGGQFRVGYVPFYAFLSEAHAPAIAFLYHSMALPADIQVRFNEQRPEHYRLFDVRSTVSEAARTMAPFLTPVATAGAFRVHRAPPSGVFDLVHVPGSAYVDRHTYYDVNDAWLQSGWVAAREHLLLDYEQKLPIANVMRLPDLSALGRPPASHGCGTVAAQDEHRAEMDVTADGCFALFKMTYHPRWRVRVDGAERTPVMVTPGFVGIPLPRGRHVIEMQYSGSVAKMALLIATIPLFFVSFFAERKGVIARFEDRCNAVPARWWNSDVRFALLVAILILPSTVPYAGSFQPNGHDALEYLPRVTEFHENIRHGILFPRWAPDLSSGQGQPLFLLNPPLFYYATELFHLAGFQFIPAMNAACVLLLLASAAAMFLLGRWYFGAAGGAIAAIAYVYAPYFLVDLYVRTAFAEFAAFPFYPLAIYGFARHAESRRGVHLLIGIASYAAIWYAHTPAALLFSPLLAAFLLFTAWRARDFRLLLLQAGAAALAFLLSASVWLPSLVESVHTRVDRLTEGPLHFAAHFVVPHQFFSSAWGYGLSLPGDQDGMPFSLGWAHLAIAGAAAVMIARSSSERWKPWLAFFGLAAFIQCFLMTQRSHALWEAVPQLHYVAFPWRLLASTTFCLALLTAAVVLALRELPVKWQPVALAAVFAALVFPALKHAQPQSYLSIDPSQWTPRQIAARGVVAGTFDTFEPRWIETRPIDNGRAIQVNRGTATPRVTRRTPTRLEAAVIAPAAAELELPISHFPGWRVRVDGTEIPLDIPSSSGRIRVSVGAGTHRLEASFERTPVRWAADGISLAALLFIIGVALWTRRRRQPIVA